MLQVRNETPFQVDKAVLVDKEGNQFWVVLVKATYLIKDDETTEMASSQEPICHAPVYSGEPGRSSLLRESEFVVEHPGTDVTILGSAYAAQQKATPVVDVGVSVGAAVKVLRVFGARIWQAGVFGPRMTSPEPFVSMPVTYERAFGGTNALAGGGQEKEPRNPIGTGFSSSADHLVGKAVPNVEDPLQLIDSWHSRPKPAGLGPIPAMWSPRLEYAGTFDERWREKRMPLWPMDYDPRQAQSAHPDLVMVEPLKGGEKVMLTNLSPNSRLSFRIPRVYVNLTTFTRTDRIRQSMQLDRVIIEPDVRKVMTVWRSSLNCRARVRDVVQTIVEPKRRLR